MSIFDFMNKLQYSERIKVLEDDKFRLLEKIRSLEQEADLLKKKDTLDIKKFQTQVENLEEKIGYLGEKAGRIERATISSGSRKQRSIGLSEPSQEIVKKHQKSKSKSKKPKSKAEKKSKHKESYTETNSGRRNCFACQQLSK